MEVIRSLFKPRTLFALLFYGTYCTLIHRGVNPPDHLINIVLVILGFYFGNKSKEAEK